ncbi:MAG TPA: DsbA family oxidoreductase [Candidatus Binatia bacterium]|nr:DsbA family oxidoreductase [Candidatus Binatia bacterium]
MAEPAVRELAEKDPTLAIVWRAFELRPDPVPTLDPTGDYLHRVWGSSVYPLAAQMGVDIKLPPVQPRSRRAHQAAHWARRHGKFREYNDALFRAFFQRGEDIGNTDVLARLASDIGLAGDDLREALDNDLYLENVLADEREAKKLGLRGVPAFVANRKIALSGVQSLESLQKLVEHARSLS